MTKSEDIIAELALALAEVDDTTPNELGYTLAEYMDLSFLKTIMERDLDCEVTFQVPDHEVTVTDAGTILIDGEWYRSSRASDLNDQNQADLPSKPKNLQFHRLVDSLPCIVYQARDKPGRPIQFISENCRELTGYDPNTFIIGGVDYCNDLIHPDDREAVRETIQASLRNEEPYSFIYRIQTADNTEKWIFETGVGLFDTENPIPLVGVMIDLTELKHDLDGFKTTPR